MDATHFVLCNERQKEHFIWALLVFSLYRKSPTGDEGTTISTWAIGQRELLAVSRAKAVPLFFNYFKTLSVVPALRIETTSCRSVLKRSTAWAIPAAVA